MKRAAYPIADVVMSPFVLASGFVLKMVRKAGVQNLPVSRGALRKVGVFPVRDHYYEPQIDFRGSPDFSLDRTLPGINWNETGQLAFLGRLTYADELQNVAAWRGELEYTLDNNQFGAGDADFWYQLIRATKPRRIFEIGSGNSTKMAVRAIKRNRQDDPSYSCKHVCVEPYEMPWLEKTGVTVVRSKVETLDVSFFSELESGDVLFIDSSHVIRPHGDVLYEYLQLLPTLKPGVIVHVHDIFSPKNYSAQWIEKDVRFWNEQYLLEAFLTHNDRWEIVGALNFLKHKHFVRFKSAAPLLKSDSEPGSFYMRKLR